jgi:hypothetical protein
MVPAIIRLQHAFIHDAFHLINCLQILPGTTSLSKIIAEVQPGIDSARLFVKKQHLAVTCRHEIEAGNWPLGVLLRCMEMLHVEMWDALFGSCYLRRFMLLL